MESITPNLKALVDASIPCITGIVRRCFRHQFEELFGQAYIVALELAPRFNASRATASFEDFLAYNLPRQLRRSVFRELHTRSWRVARVDDDTVAAASFSVPSGEPGPAEICEKKSVVEEAKAIIGRLPKKPRQAASLLYVEGLTRSEAADAMGITPPHLSALAHRAIHSLRASMAA